MKNLQLTIGYSTMAHRVGDIVPPIARADWGVSIVIQNPEEIAWRGSNLAALFSRDDIEVEEISSIGVAKSRNRNITLAKGKYLVFGDDDVTFSQAGLDEAISFLEKNQEVALVLGQAVDESGALRKRYPTVSQELTKFNSARAATYEMVVNVETIRRLGVLFDEEFGAGAKHYLGDEYIFIVDLLRAGGRAVFLPITLAIHPSDSSGSRWGSQADRRARAAIFARVFGNWAPFVRAIFGVRRFTELGSIKNLVFFIFGK